MYGYVTSMNGLTLCRKLPDSGNARIIRSPERALQAGNHVSYTDIVLVAAATGRGAAMVRHRVRPRALEPGILLLLRQLLLIGRQVFRIRP